MKARRLLTTILATAAGFAVLATTATAQEPGPFDPLGIRAGGFLIYPSLRLQGAYDDNVFATESNTEDDLIFIIRPSVEARSNFPRHALNLGAGSEIAIHDDFGNEDYQDFHAFANGRLDVLRDAAIGGQLRFDRLHESRESPEDIGDPDNLQTYKRFIADLNYAQTFNRLSFRVGGGATLYDYSQVAGVGDDRDRKVYRTDLRVGYQVSPRFNVFGQGRYNWERFDDDVDRFGFQRDSDGFALEAGVDIEISAVMLGEVFGGYRRQSYDDPAFDSVDGFGFGGALTWYPTLLTTVGLSLSRDIEATTQAGAAGNFKTDVGLRVDHELLRNVVLNATAGYTRDDFQGDDRRDNTIRLGAGASYLLNRNLSVDAGYRFTDRDSNVDGRDYRRHVVLLGITGRL